MPRRLVSLAVPLVLVALIAVACGAASTSTPASGSSTLDPSTFALEVGTVDLYVGDPQRVQFGVYSSSSEGGIQLVTFGQIGLRLTGPSAESAQATARYIAAPGTAATGASPVLSDPGVARGVYQLDGVSFDAPGIWSADVTVELTGGTLQLSTQFQVNEHPTYPAPGDRAPATDTLTMDPDAPAQAIDSRAQDGDPIPDPELHAISIAQALKRDEPVLVVFATPVYCVSQFCGPVTDAVQQLADEHPDLATYIHVEIWRNHEKSVVNAGAAEWLLRQTDLFEPWLYLIGADGRIVDRWMPLFDPDEVLAELESLPTG
jgi:hypothetical protein